MKTTIKIWIVMIILSILISCQPFKDVDVPVQETEKGFYVTKLDNGMTVTVKEVPNLPLVTIQFWVKVGSRNEIDENRGIAHIFEHIWFKGTPTQPVGSFDKTIASFGGYVNAMTGQDFTAFYVIVPGEKFEETLALMVDLFQNQLFDEEEIAREKEVIIEESKMTYNDPVMWTDNQFAQTLFTKHPYKHPILGYEETIKDNMPDEIKEFYQTWHVPNNMNLIIIGDITKEEAEEAANLYIGGMKPKELPVLDIVEEPEQTAMRFEIETRKGLENTYASIGYRIPSFKNQDWYALKVLTQILDGAESARIPRIVQIQKELISSSETFFVPLQDMGAIETIIVIKPQDEQEAIQAILDEFNKFKTQYVTNEELESAKKQLQAGYALEQEEIVQQGVDIGYWWASGNFERQQQYLEDIFKITKEDIMRAANKYLKYPTIFVLRPE